MDAFDTVTYINDIIHKVYIPNFILSNLNIELCTHLPRRDRTPEMC